MAPELIASIQPHVLLTIKEPELRPSAYFVSILQPNDSSEAARKSDAAGTNFLSDHCSTFLNHKRLEMLCLGFN